MFLHFKYSNLFSHHCACCFKKQIAIGQRHSMALTEEGKVWVWGTGDDGRLGLGDEKDRPFPELMETLVDFNVINIGAGGHHSACLADDGNLWTWGDGSFGRCGLRSGTPKLTPHLVVALVNESKRFDDLVHLSLFSNHASFDDAFQKELSRKQFLSRADSSLALFQEQNKVHTYKYVCMCLYAYSLIYLCKIAISLYYQRCL